MDEIESNSRADSNRLDNVYFKLLNDAINKKFPLWSQLEIAQKLGISINTYNNFINSGTASDRIISKIADYVGVINYKVYKKRLPIIRMIEKKLYNERGIWVSYSLDPGRRLFQSIWTFQKEEIVENLSNSKKNKQGRSPSQKAKLYQIKAKKVSTDGIFTGVIEVKDDLSLSMKVEASEEFRIEYRSFFDEREYNSEWQQNFHFIIFEATIIKKAEEKYSTLVLFSKQLNEGNFRAKLMEKSIVPMDRNSQGIPQSVPYLAFNYLTRAASKAQRVFSNHSINIVREGGRRMGYEHSIYISTPVSFLRRKGQENKEKYSYFKKVLEAISGNLNKEHGFHENDIHCELLKCRSYEDISYYDRDGFFDQHNLINSMHHIAILPKMLRTEMSGVYLEIYFRIMKRRPSVIFVEDRSILPHFLHGVLDSRERPINVGIKDLTLEDIPHYIETRGESLFNISF